DFVGIAGLLDTDSAGVARTARVRAGDVIFADRVREGSRSDEDDGNASGNETAHRSLLKSRMGTRYCWYFNVVSSTRSPHGAKRNAGAAAPDAASLHPGDRPLPAPVQPALLVRRLERPERGDHSEIRRYHRAAHRPSVSIALTKVGWPICRRMP